MRPERRVASALMVLLLLVGTAVGTSWTVAEDGDDAVDPFGPAEGPIPFPIIDVSSSFDEDRFPKVLAGDGTITVVWNKGARGVFVYHVVEREFDGEAFVGGEEWVSKADPDDHVFEHQHYSHEGTAVGYRGMVYFVWASDDANYTHGDEHDIVLRALDPATGAWGDVVEVTPNDAGQDRDPEVAVFKDRLVIAWRTNDANKADGADDDIVMRTYDGAAFSDIVQVSVAGDDTMDAALDVGVVGDRLAFVWEWVNGTNGPSDWDVLYREWDGTGFTSAPVPVAPDPARVSKLPKVDAVAGKPFVVWENRPPTGEPGAVGIMGRVMDGTAPGLVVDITRPGSGAENVQPEVVSAGDMAFVLWSSFDDSLTHGPDSDIVMASFDGETLGEVQELSHPRDGDDVDEGFVTACVFQDNLYAVWRMLWYLDPPIPVGINEDIVVRRVTDYAVDLSVGTGGLLDDGENAVEVDVSTFYGTPADASGLDIEVVVTRAGNVVGSVDLTGTGSPGGLSGTFSPTGDGTYSFIVTLDGREVAREEARTQRIPNGDGSSDVSIFVYYVAGALVLLSLAGVFAYRQRK